MQQPSEKQRLQEKGPRCKVVCAGRKQIAISHYHSTVKSGNFLRFMHHGVCSNIVVVRKSECYMSVACTSSKLCTAIYCIRDHTSEHKLQEGLRCFEIF